MKKILLIISTILLSVFAFVGCDPKIENRPTGISFIQKNFYVDIDVPTKLDYKVYPSTATGYSIDYERSGNDEYLSYFNFAPSTGVFEATGIPDGYTGERPLATITIKMGSYTDSCNVYLKLYPQSVKFENAEYVLNGGGSLSLPLMKEVSAGNFTVCNTNEYKYEVISSNTNIVSVEDSQALLIKSTGVKGTSEITVNVIDGLGNIINNLTAKTTIKVETAVDNIFAYISNTKASYMLENGADYTYEEVQENAYFDVVARFFDSEGYLLENTQFNVYVSNSTMASVSGARITINQTPTQTTVIEVTLVANNTDDVGGVVTIRFNIVLYVPEVPQV